MVVVVFVQDEYYESWFCDWHPVCIAWTVVRVLVFAFDVQILVHPGFVSP